VATAASLIPAGLHRTPDYQDRIAPLRMHVINSAAEVLRTRPGKSLLPKENAPVVCLTRPARF